MRLAFTGTQIGMTGTQMLKVKSLVLQLDPLYIAHGDCIGADNQFQEIVEDIRGPFGNKPYIHIYPSNLESKRAGNEDAEVIHPPAPPLERNREMAQWCDKLIAAPKENKEVFRSGTWTTIRYAKRYNKIVYIVLPDGTVI